MSMLNVSYANDRAKKKLAEHGSLVVPAQMNIACSTVTFAYEHIHLLEEQLGAAQNRIRELEALVKYTEATKE